MRPQQSRVDVRASSGEVQRLTIMLLTAFAVCPALSFAQPTDSRLTASPTVGRFTPAIALGQQRERVVVLKLAGDPVAVVRGRMPGKQISESDRQTIETNLRAQQQPI
ncbi:MAG: hypothetical protein E6K49_14560, partial [Gammaproteobacteria bacterium]